MYMIYSFGEKTEDVKQKFRTLGAAQATFRRLVRSYCDEQEVDLDDGLNPSYDVEYEVGESFFCGWQDAGVDIYRIVEIPKFANEVDELIWKAKLELDKADDAASDYAYSLMDNNVSYYTDQARLYMDKAIKIINDAVGDIKVMKGVKK